MFKGYHRRLAEYAKESLKSGEGFDFPVRFISFAV